MEASAAERIVAEWSPPANRMAIAVLALVGALVASYLLLHNLGLTGPVACGIGDCATVQNSRYARIAGIPVSALGLAGYLALVVLALLGLRPGLARARWISVLLLGGALAGVLFSAYLTFLEAFVIRAWCQWCVISAVLITLIFVGSLPEVKRVVGTRTTREGA